MDAGKTTGRVAWLTFVMVFAGCATGASPTPATPITSPAGAPSAAAATPAASTTTAATPNPMPTAASYGPVTVVTGISDCGTVEPIWTTNPDGTLHARTQTLECTDTTNDPRVSGSHIATWSMDVWGSLVAGAGVQWGTVRIENAGGTWEGEFSGVASLPEPGDAIVEWYRGTGDYEGLAYFLLVTGVCCVYPIHGQIFPGDPPAAS